MLNMWCINIIGRRVEVDKKGWEPARGKWKHETHTLPLAEHQNQLLFFIADKIE